MSRSVPALAATTALGALFVLMAAAPATAAPGALPATDTIYAVDCEEEIGLLVTVDAVTADATPIGEGTDDPAISCAGPSSFDPTTGYGFWISWGSDDYLARVDIATGVSTIIGEFLTAEDESVNAASMAIGADGSAYVIGGVTTYGDVLYSLDLTTGVVTEIGEFPGTESNWWSFAFNPVDGEFYAISMGSDGGFYRVDVETAVETLIESQDDIAADIYGLAFDSEGAAWVLGYDFANEDEWALLSSSVDAFGADLVSSGVLELNGESWFSESLFIVPSEAPAPAPEPQLAATGVEPALWGGAIAAALLAVGGVALAASRRRLA